MTITAKICGITTQAAIDCCAASGAAYVGFVYFQKSPRHIDPEAIRQLNIPTPLQSVAVVVDQSVNQLMAFTQKFTPDYFQLHGHETPEDITALRGALDTEEATKNVGIIKAISVHSKEDIDSALQYEACVDMLLFDAKPPKGALPGGNGLFFDWNLLKPYRGQKPWFLSGGLSIDTVEEAVRLSGARMVDISSGVESKPGHKDHTKISDFLRKVQDIAL